MQLTEEEQAETRELVKKLAICCRGYEDGLVMFALEAAMQASIEEYGTPELGELFHTYMQDYKAKANVLLHQEPS